MRLKGVILQNLGRDDLRRVVDALGVDGADRRSGDAMRAALGACRGATPQAVLDCLGKESLKTVCAAVGARTGGRRGELIQRLLAENGASPTPKGTKREIKMSEAEPDGGIQKQLPSGVNGGRGGKLDLPLLGSGCGARRA